VAFVAADTVTASSRSRFRHHADTRAEAALAAANLAMPAANPAYLSLRLRKFTAAVAK